MLRHALPLLRPGIMICLVALAACQISAARSPPANVADAGLPAVPDCAAGMSATLSDGLRIGYQGSDPNDPDRCLLDWSGRSYPLYFGLWSTGPDLPMSDNARAAFRAALTGPVGTEADFEMQRATMWKRVTVTHVANSMVEVSGTMRSALELRVVLCNRPCHRRTPVAADRHANGRRQGDDDHKLEDRGSGSGRLTAPNPRH